eukprot:13048714-Ditylum_brightwellii.AAC.1
MEHALKENEGCVLAVKTTPSCFDLWIPDQIDEVGKLFMKEDAYHVINNVYGLQCKKTRKLINRACTVGRVGAIVCSTDKNLLVPVGRKKYRNPYMAAACAIVLTEDEFDEFFACLDKAFKDIFAKRKKMMPEKLGLGNFK